jgi:uncharacterized protein (TIGR02271 family)
MNPNNDDLSPEGQMPLSVPLSHGEPLIIPVIHEELQIEIKTVETGKVHIAKKVIEEVSVLNQTQTSEQVMVERIPINQYVDSAPQATRQEGDVTIISVVKEVLVVEKRLMLVEEIRLTRQKTQENKEFTATLRKEEISVERTVSGTEF